MIDSAARMFGCCLTLACFIASPASAAEPEVIFTDSFDGKLAREWTWIKQNDKAWRIKDGALELRVMPGVDNIPAVALPDASAGPYAVEVTLTSVPAPTQQYEQVGFAWFHEGKQRFKYVKERIDGKLYVFPGKKPMDKATVRMRIEVRGEKFTAKYQPDAKGELLTAFDGKLPGGGKGKHQVGLHCFHGPKDAEHWIRCDDFRIVKLKK